MNKNNPVFAKILKSHYLPDDIIQEIFYRLPSKSVFRFKAVNKEWNSILSSAQFMHKHCSHRRRIRRVADDHLILLEREQLYHGSYNNLFNPKAAASAALENPHNCRRGKGCSAKPEILGSCNGLVALSLRDCYNEYMLWNPVTKKHISVYPEDYCDGRRLLSGLCYNASCNEYSVVLAAVFYKHGKVRVSAVNFRTGRGKEVEKSMCFKVHNVEQQVGTVVCGVPHWLAFISELESPRVIQKEIIYFDLADEVFRQMARPDHAGVKEKEVVGFGALNAQHQLGIVLRDCENSDLDLWVMTEYGKSKSWTMMFTISLTEFVKPPIFVHLLGIMPTRELLMVAIVNFYDEFDDDVEKFRAVGVYHPVKRVLWQKEVEFLSRRDCFYAFVTAYEPSVISPPELEIQDKIMSEVAEYQHCLVSSVSPPHLKILEKTKGLVEDDHDESSLVWFDCEPSFESPPQPEMQDIETKELVWYDCGPSFGSPPRPEMQEIVTKELVKYDCEPSHVSPPRQEVQDVKTEELVEYEPSGAASPPQLEKEESEAETIMELVDCPKPSYRDILMGTLTK